MQTQTSNAGGMNVEYAHRVAVIINVGLIASLGIYAMLVEILKHNIHAQQTTEALGVVRTVFFIVGISLVIAIKYICKGIMLNKTRGESRHSLIARLQRYSVVTAALCETPGILGLVLFVLGGSRIDFYILLAMSAGMYAVYFPRLSTWKGWIGSAARST